MAQTATLYTLDVNLADIDRDVYKTFTLHVARHPSETAAYMLTRVLAYCLEYCDGIELTEGVSAGEEPALVVRDLTGTITAWIEVGLPDATRLHRGSKMAGRAAIYTHRDVQQLLTRLDGRRVYRADAIPIRAFDRHVIEEAAELVARRTELTVSVSDREIMLMVNDRSFELAMSEHRLSARP